MPAILIDGIAIYGALLSSILALLAVLRYRAESVRVEVRAEHSYLVSTDAERAEVIVLTAVNVGKRPITIVSGCLVLSDGEQFAPTYVSHFGNPPPCKLEDGDVCSLWFHADTVRDAEEQQHPNKVVAVRFRDAARRSFQSAFRIQPKEG